MNIMRKIIISVLILLASSVGANAQTLGIKTNLMEWAAFGTANLGLELSAGNHVTIGINGAVNPWQWSGGRSSRGWGGELEVNHYFSYKYYGHHIGLFGHYADYDLGMRKYNFDGKLYGGGISYGYTFVLSDHLRLDLHVGAGYDRLDYDRNSVYTDPSDIVRYGHETKNWFGPNKAGLTFIYVIK